MIRKALTGRLLVEMNAITEEQLALCLEEQVRLRAEGRHMRIGQLVLHNRFATPVQAALAIERSAGLRTDLDAIPWPVRRKHKFVVAGVRDRVLRVGSIDPLTNRDGEAILAAARHVGYPVDAVRRVPMDKAEILASLRQGTHVDAQSLKAQFESLALHPEDGARMQRAVEHLLVDALQCRASDVHLARTDEPGGNWISFRVDGVLRPRYLLAARAMAPFATRVKNLAGMDFAQTRFPQDGRMTFPHEGREIDLRVAVIPREAGESIVIRLLDQTILPSVEDLFRPFPDALAIVSKITGVSRKTGGLVLVTGPTGSGKTSTLYAMVAALRRDRLKVMTSEDPIEFRMALVHQTQVNERTGLTFAEILRAQLRQDPDVLVVGEMRDSVTAEVVTRSAESGHMLFTSLHTANVVQAITKLIGLMPDEFRPTGRHVLAHLLRLVLSQDLVPRLCACAASLPAERHPLFAVQRERVGVGARTRVAVARGCAHCGETGYRGRVMAPEVLALPPDPAARSAIGRILNGAVELARLREVAGVFYQSREASLKALVEAGLIDFDTALAALDVVAPPASMRSPPRQLVETVA